MLGTLLGKLLNVRTLGTLLNVRRVVRNVVRYLLDVRC